MSIAPSLLKLKAWHESTRYIVVCNTCSEVFFDISLEELGKLLTGTNTSPLWSPHKQKWYLKAARHWIENQHHHIVTKLMNVEKQVDQEFFDLSADWTRGLTLEPDQSKAAMLREIEHLESTQL
jgi:hypothetical protein